MKKTLTPAQLAALAAGATMDEVVASAAIATTTDPDETDLQPAVASLTAQVEALSLELAAAQATVTEQAEKLVTIEAGMVSATAEAAQAKLTADTMTDTIMGRVKQMGIALNAKVPETCEDAAELVKLHAELDTQFKDKFKTARVSASTATTAVVKPMWSEAQLAAAKAIQIY